MAAPQADDLAAVFWTTRSPRILTRPFLLTISRLGNVTGVTAINDGRAAGRGAGKFDSRFNRLGAGIGEEHFVEMRPRRQADARPDSGQGGHAHLHEVRQFALEHRRQCLTNRRVIATTANTRSRLDLRLAVVERRSELSQRVWAATAGVHRGWLQRRRRTGTGPGFAQRGGFLRRAYSRPAGRRVSARSA
jgi:hypothetical protein